MNYTTFRVDEIIGGGDTIEDAVRVADEFAQETPRSTGLDFTVYHAGMLVYTTHACGAEKGEWTPAPPRTETAAYDAPAGAGDDVEAYRG